MLRQIAGVDRPLLFVEKLLAAVRTICLLPRAHQQHMINTTRKLIIVEKDENSFSFVAKNDKSVETIVPLVASTRSFDKLMVWTSLRFYHTGCGALRRRTASRVAALTPDALPHALHCTAAPHGPATHRNAVDPM